MSSPSTSPSPIGTCQAVATETTNCVKCGTLLRINKSMNRTGGIVRCHNCGAILRRMMDPLYMENFTDASTNQEYDPNQFYYVFDKLQMRYFNITITDEAAYKAAILNYGKLYRRTEFKIRDVFTPIN